MPIASTVRKIVDVTCGIFIPPLDAFFGLVYMLRSLGRRPNYYVLSMQSLMAGERERQERYFMDKTHLQPLSSFFSRFFTIAMTAFCILGLIGALAVPLPGIAPLYTLTTMAVLKAIGISFGYVSLARLLGAAIGVPYEAYRMNKFLPATNIGLGTEKQNSKNKDVSIVSIVLKTVLGLGLAGNGWSVIAGRKKSQMPKDKPPGEKVVFPTTHKRVNRRLNTNLKKGVPGPTITSPFMTSSTQTYSSPPTSPSIVNEDGSQNNFASVHEENPLSRDLQLPGGARCASNR